MTTAQDTIEVWAKGYADRDGVSRFQVPHGTPRAQIEAEASDRFGACARVNRIIPAPQFGPPRKPFSAAYIRMMSQGG